jgi:hypothetical protein
MANIIVSGGGSAQFSTSDDAHSSEFNVPGFVLVTTFANQGDLIVVSVGVIQGVNFRGPIYAESGGEPLHLMVTWSGYVGNTSTMVYWAIAPADGYFQFVFKALNPRNMRATAAAFSCDTGWGTNPAGAFSAVDGTGTSVTTTGEAMLVGVGNYQGADSGRMPVLAPVVDFEADSYWTPLLSEGSNKPDDLILKHYFADGSDGYVLNHIGIGGMGLFCLHASEAGVYPITVAAHGASVDITTQTFVFSFYPAPPPAPPPPKPDIVTDISERAGLTASQIDVSKLLVSANFPTLGNVVSGYFIERPTPAAQILRVLMGAYFFDACEEDGKVRYVPRGAASALTIPEGDLGLVTDKRKILETQGQEQDLPKQIVVLYPDPKLDYQQGNQPYSRNVRTVHTRNQEIKSIPITMPGTQAKQIAQIDLYTKWTERDSYATNLWRAIYMRLSPTDVLEFVYEGLTFTMRVVENSLGAGYVVSIQGVSEDARNYISTAVAAADAGFSPAPMILAALTTLFLFDLPLLSDTDSNPAGTGYYYAMSSLLKTWPGAVLYDSSDDVAFAAETTDNQPVSFGTATTALGAPLSPWIWDRVNTLTIQMAFGALAGDTMLNVLNGSNVLIVGNEIIQYANAVQNMDGTFTISTLLRGRRGTEWASGTHAVGDLVFVVASPATVRRMALPLAIVNLLRYYRAVTVGQDLTTAATQNFTITGADLKPYAPVHIKGTRDGSGNLTLTWVRRTRIGWRSLSQDPVPLSEDSELYEVDILNGATVVRTLTGLTSPTAAYSAAQQITDIGSVQAEVTVNVYQVSAQVGKGFAGGATV